MTLSNQLLRAVAPALLALSFTLPASAGSLAKEWDQVASLLPLPSAELASQLLNKKTPVTSRRSIPVVFALTASFDQIPVLVQILEKDSDARVRESAVVSLGYLGALMRRLGQELPGIGGDSLVKITEGLSLALKDKNVDVRKQAAASLASVGVAVEKSFEALVDLLEDTENPASQEAALALGNFHDRLEDAKALLVPRLDDSHEAVRVSAAAALLRLGYSSPKVVASIEQGLRSRDANAREAAVTALSMFSGPGIIPGLWRSLDDPEPAVRISAANSLAVFGPAARITGARLGRMLKFDRFPGVRIAAALALPQILGEEAIPTLSTALDQNRGEVGIWAAAALASLGPQGILVLDRALQGPSERARKNARLALELVQR